MEKIFIDGLRVDKRAGAPEWVIANLSFDVIKFRDFAEKNQNGGGYLNVDVKLSKGGKMYAELNTYQSAAPKPAPQEPIEAVDTTIPYSEEEVNTEDIPF